MKVLFFMGHDGFLRNFESTLASLSHRGHDVHLALTNRRSVLMAETESLEVLCAQHPRITFDKAPKGRDTAYALTLETLYATRNYLRFLQPRFAEATKLRDRAERYAPDGARALARLPGARSRAFDAALAAAARSQPTSPELDEYIANHAPDVALFTPLIGFGLVQAPALRSAKRLGVRTALLVHSWDNLTNKGLIHDVPDRVLVWNDIQVDEAVELHGIPRNGVVVTGAPGFDHWLDREVTTTRRTFASRVGLDSDRRFVLYACSSQFIAPDEVTYFKRWLDHLRRSDDPHVRELSVLVRTHPQNEEQWRAARVAERGRVALHPSTGSVRNGAAAQQEYFESIFHASAVVGVNTSAMIEAGLVGRAVLTVRDGTFRDTQDGTLHFSHLTAGAVEVAGSLDEHERQLGAAVVRAGAASSDACDAVERLVRPRGEHARATDAVVEAVEELAAAGATAVQGARLLLVLRPLLRLVAQVALRGRDRRERRPTAEPGLRLLFFMRSINYDRHFECALRELLVRRHRIHVAFDVEKKGRAGDSALFDALRLEFGDRLSYGAAPQRRRAAWERIAEQLRLAIDYLRFLEPAFAHAPALRDRVARRAPAWATRTAESRLLGRPSAARALGAVVRGAERALPLDRGVVEYVRNFAPDAVLVTPLVGLGSPQGDFVRAARRLGVPSAVLVASWDNLTNKGVIRDVPDRTIVWNEAQRREAADLHAIDPASVVVTGAHTYDHWFGWTPSTARERFCRTVGLDPERPYLLYVCSSSFIAPEEVTFVREWIARLRAADDSTLRDVGVLVRPHPANARMWEEADLDDPGGVVVFPREGAMPTTHEAKSAYYDSIYHARAVVGVNTSALIESGIVGRPVFTVLAPDFRDTQEGTLHFGHLAGGKGEALLTVAQTYDEHLTHLAAAVADQPGRSTAPFVESFVRPHGRDVPAAPRLADAVEATAALNVPRVRPKMRHAVTRAALAPFVVVVPRLAHRLAQLGFRHRRPLHRTAEAHTSRKLLVILDHPGLLIHFDETLQQLLARGNRVHLAFTRPQKFAALLDALDLSHPLLTVHRKLPKRKDWYLRVAKGIRAAADYIHYLDPSLEGARYSRAKWREHAQFPPPFGFLQRRETLNRPMVRLLLRALSVLEGATPSEYGIERLLEKVQPDALVVSPLIDAKTAQEDYVKSARALGIPTAVCVASWDNLTSKGLIRIVPDRVIVWNEHQAREAVELHAAPAQTVVVTGAQSFDRWFEREPTTTRDEFCSRMGLPADKPYLLFVGSTKQDRSDEAEPLLVRRWLEALRACDDPVLRDVAILVRPHPTNAVGWGAADVSDLGDVAVAKRQNTLPPVFAADRAEYFDSMYHAAAVVGVNSSAMVEAAIVGRAVHTVALPELRTMQRDLLHYHYLLEENGGFLREARDYEEHIGLLGEDLRADPRIFDARRRPFLEAFVRPRGLDVDARSVLVQTIEQLADLEPLRAPEARVAMVPPRLALATVVVAQRLRVRWHRSFGRGARRANKVFGTHSKIARARAQAKGTRRPVAIVSAWQGVLLKALAKAAARVDGRHRKWLEARGEAAPRKEKPKSAAVAMPPASESPPKAKQKKPKPKAPDRVSHRRRLAGARPTATYRVVRGANGSARPRKRD